MAKHIEMNNKAGLDFCSGLWKWPDEVERDGCDWQAVWCEGLVLENCENGACGGELFALCPD